MKKVSITLIVALFLSHALAAQSKHASVQGVWQVVEITFTGSNARTMTIPEPRPNLTILSAKHYSQIHDDTARTRPVLGDAAKASADQLRASWGPFSGDAGSYEVNGNVITMRPIVAKNPAAMAPGAFTSYVYTLEGDTLRITEQRNQNGPLPNPVSLKAVRVE